MKVQLARYTLLIFFLLGALFFASPKEVFAYSCSGQCRGTCLTPSQVEGSGDCENPTYKCCVSAPTAPPGTCSSGSCKSSCSIGEVSVGTCSGGTCCAASTGCGGTCRSSCLSGEYAISGTCSTGLSCCSTTTKNCAFSSGCYPNNNGCGTGQVWVTNYRCASTVSCSSAPSSSSCTNLGGACVNSTSCGTCIATSCEATCGLGGCPGGCGARDNCGGVSCDASGCSGGEPTSNCGNGTCGTGESCNNCEEDCGSCPPTSTPTTTATPPPTCPNGTCGAGETCSNCPDDCGACSAPGTARARGVVISASATSCTEVLASSTFIQDQFSLAPNNGTSNTTQSVSGTNYATWANLAPDNVTYTITDTPQSGYVLNYACWETDSPAAEGTGRSGTIPAGATKIWTFGYSAGAGWWQSQGGDVYGFSDLRSFVPTTASPAYLSLDGTGLTPGVVTYGSTYDFSSDTSSTGETLVSSEGWLVDDPLSDVNFYNLMYSRFGSPTDTDFASGTTLTGSNTALPEPNNGNAYYVNGNLTIDTQDWTIGASESKVFLIDGNLTINRNINITAGGFVAFIVSGDITISPNVGSVYNDVTPDIEGVYIANGTFYTGATTAAATARFVGKGTFVAGDFMIERDFDTTNPGQNLVHAASLFIYNPQLLLTMPDKMKDLPVNWEEVAP